MPAAAVIPAPIAYTKVVAVKKLVVEFLDVPLSLSRARYVLICGVHPRSERMCHSVDVYGYFVIYCEQNRVFKAGLCR